MSVPPSMRRRVNSNTRQRMGPRALQFAVLLAEHGRMSVANIWKMVSATEAWKCTEQQAQKTLWRMDVQGLVHTEMKLEPMQRCHREKPGRGWVRYYWLTDKGAERLAAELKRMGRCLT